MLFLSLHHYNKELAERYQDSRSYAMLAEACMNISEPDRAVRRCRLNTSV